jgi:hypothetical protein
MSITPRSVLRHRPIDPDLDGQAWAIATPAKSHRCQLSPASQPSFALVGLSMLLTFLLLCIWPSISS